MRAIAGVPAAVAGQARPVLLWVGSAFITAVVTVNMLGGPFGVRLGYWHGGPVMVVGFLALVAALLWRYPLAAFVLLVLGVAVVAVVFPDDRVGFGPMLPVDVAVCYIAATRRRWVAAVALGLALAVPAGYVVTRMLNGDDTRVWFFQSPVVYGVVFAWLIGVSIAKSRQLAAASRTQAADRAMTAERLRIARELHDMVAHSVGIIAIQAGMGSRVIASRPAEAQEALRVIETTSREALSGLRQTLIALRRAEPRPVASDAAPGLADLDRLAAGATDAGVRATVHRAGPARPLPPEVELAAYRIVQEALTNVIRHSGARLCRVTVEYRETELAVEVVDDGRGSPSTSTGRGFGIIGMRERVGLLGGRLEAGPRPHRGYRVAANLPLDDAAETLAEQATV